MKLIPHYQLKNDRLTLTFDPEAQHAIQTVAAQISQLFGGRDPSKLPQDRYECRDDNLLNGYRLLKRLGKTSKLQVATTGRDAHLALGLVCWSTAHLAHEQEPSCGPDTAVLLLAGVAPVDLPPGYLPAAAAVFGQRRIPTQMRQSYENVRMSLGGPACFMLQIYRLSQELQRLSRPSKALRQVIDTLGAYSILMAMALRDVASAGGAGKSTAKSTARKNRRPLISVAPETCGD